MKLKSIKAYTLAMLLAPAMLLTSCDKNSLKSLSELKSEQKDAITKLIADKKMKVVRLSEAKLPATIDKDVYYLLPNGLYMRVLDAGSTTKKAEAGKTTIFTTFKGYQFTLATMKGPTINNHSDPGFPPVEFTYISRYSAGEIHYSLVEQTAPQLNYDNLMCEGIAYPMTLLGDKAKVSLIIPFEIGPNDTYSKGVSTYWEIVEYTFKN